MRKTCLTGIFFSTRTFAVGFMAIGFTIAGGVSAPFSGPIRADESTTVEEPEANSADDEPSKDEPADKKKKAVETKEVEKKDAEKEEQPLPEDYWSQDETPVYPRGATLGKDRLWIVDSDAHGVWGVPWPITEAAKPARDVTGSRYLRKIMNRPFCALAHPESGVLVGDAATREIYHVTLDEKTQQGQQAKPLNNGYLGIPMALAVSADKKTLYVGDAERRAVFKLPITGGKPELVVRVNARGLVFDKDGALWAVTPDADAVEKINVEDNTSEAIVTDRPYGFPGGIAWHDGTGFVSDVYERCVWTFTADGKTEKWFEGEPLLGPVGLTATAEAVLVSDPKTKQVYRIDRKDKKVTPLLK